MGGIARLFVLCIATVALAGCLGDNQHRAACDATGSGAVDCSDPACAGADLCLPACGNGKLEPGEQCDDGNLVDADGCEHDCTLPACGNHIIDRGEQCDDGNVLDADGCEHDCTLPACGNGIIDRGEQCDDGNLTDADGCEHDCTLPACGNGIVDSGEQCDDGNLADADGCEHDCTIPGCGNSIVDPGEQCDDGNATDGDGCDRNCTLPGCGNSIVDSGEQCDDGNLTDADGCEHDCKLPVCGNGIVDPGEQCDDGNLADADGCEHDCKLPVCGNGIVDAGESCDDGNAINGDACDNNCTFPACGNGIVDPGEQCDDGNVTNWDGCDASCTTSANALLKAPITGTFYAFGFIVALSADGSTLAVAELNDASAATGINGDPTDRSARGAGAVYVYTRDGATWRQQAYIKASNTEADDEFGSGLALSADGSTLAVGASFESSAATGIDGDELDNSAPLAGAVYVFVRDGETWSQQAYVKASNTGAHDLFGWSVAVSADGSTLAVGARVEASAATGVDGDQTDNSAGGAGAVYVFTRSGKTWSQQAYIKASNTEADDLFGNLVALSSDGATLAVGALQESSAATGIDGDQADNSARFAGAVYVFTRTGATWSQQAYVKASNTDAGDSFGWSLALSADGSTLAVGATDEQSNATGMDGNQADNSLLGAGAAYVFTRTGATWRQQAYVKASNTDVTDFFGSSVALSSDGSTLAVGAVDEKSGATGINGNQFDNRFEFAGAVYVLTRSGATWSQQAYVKASNTTPESWFGFSVALSANGLTLAVGAVDEDGGALDAGAVYVYR